MEAYQLTIPDIQGIFLLSVVVLSCKPMFLLISEMILRFLLPISFLNLPILFDCVDLSPGFTTWGLLGIWKYSSHFHFQREKSPNHMRFQSLIQGLHSQGFKQRNWISRRS